MHPAPDVSVVTPTLHREGLLAQSVGSALSQRGVTVEVLVLDDSPDGSARAATEAIGDARVHYVGRPGTRPRKPAEVRQEGAYRARGRYVHFLDDDDVLVDGALSSLVFALDRDPEVGVAFGAVVPFGEDDQAVARIRAHFGRAADRARKLQSRYELAACLLFKELMLTCSACIIRRTLAAEVGWDPSIPFFEDGDFYLRAVRAHGFTYVDRPVVHYRTGAPSRMNDARCTPAACVRSYQMIHEKYRRVWGALEYGALRVLALAL